MLLNIARTQNMNSLFYVYMLHKNMNFIPQSSLYSAHGGLTFYLHKQYVFKKLPIYVQSEVWKGLFIEISGLPLNK